MKTFILSVLTLILASSMSAQVETLPAPIINNKSFEIISNNRYSVHSGFSSSLSNQVLSNVLWATNKVPRIGTYREIYVATPTNVYRYDTTNHTLVLHLAGNHRYVSGSAFEVGMASNRQEEVGLMEQAGLLAGNAFRDMTASSNVASCPMKYAANYANTNWNPSHTIECVNVFGRYNMTALDTTCLAVSSNSSLPRPQTDGQDTFETALARINQDSIFSPTNLSLPIISQLAWAGYGVTPHIAISNRRELTVPSAVAAYYLTRKIYIVRDVGVDRYNNRQPPGTGLTTADHRLEQMTSEDRRAQLRLASNKIPSTAPVYFVICVSDTASYGPMQEAGFVAFQLMMQAEIIGLNYFITVPLSRTERTAIISALSIPTTDIPVIVFSCGTPAISIKETEINTINNDQLQITSINKDNIQIEIWLDKPAAPEIAIYDLTGKLIYNIKARFNKSGHHIIEWNRKDINNRKVSAGAYICQITYDQNTFSKQFILTK